ncbi:MAG: hypothetical protein M3434_06970, partial [Gemmatimonadota bacterium]|nr:hypothetical protein [Gemmatimonadota bacterium]
MFSQIGQAAEGRMLATESETLSASMATFSSLRPGNLGNNVMESFDAVFMPCFVAHATTLLHRKRRRA